MKIDMGPKALEWMGTGIQAAMIAMKGVNFTLKQMVTKTAARLNVAESQVAVSFGRSDGPATWGWQASVTKGGVRHTGTSMPDPMHALGSLVQEIEG